MEINYVGTKTRSNRPGWSVTFRHPLRRDTRGKLGLKVRRGLNTADDREADALVDQLNTLLADRSWWTVDRRSDAEREFAPQIVSAFFDGIEVGSSDTAQLRDQIIPLPSADDGYARVLIVGTTGAGKTTLLRHLIGSTHEHDRFPSTSAARTTIADTEIVTADAPFSAAVTFMSEFQVRAHIDECIEAACLAAVEGQPNTKIAATLLTHREQRFRLSYTLGDFQTDDDDEEDDFSFDEPSADSSEDSDAIPEAERKQNSHRIAIYLERIERLAADMSAQTAEELGSYGEQESPDDKARWLELYSDNLFESNEFAKLALDIKGDVESRFDRLSPDEFERSVTNWPLIWTFETEDRSEFLHKVRWFSSNHFRQFGRLLTPLVDGVRVQGPFKPLLEELQITDKLVLLDGQGLGHTTESASSISTKVTKRFRDVDLILLVDSAKQPMQAAPLALLRAAASAGCADKVLVGFSHFDQVKGDNLHTLSQKRNHVLASITSAIAGLRPLLGASAATALEHRMEKHVFLLGALDREIDAIPSGVITEMGKLLQLLQAAAVPPIPIEAAPTYALGELELALRDAVDSFLRPWEARLGLAYRDGIRAEHHTRVRALSRRFANDWSDEYDNLRPASDLIGRLQEEISRWLDNPTDWTRVPYDDDERAAALKPIRSTVFGALHELVKKRLGDRHREDWQNAYVMSGRGSCLRRSGEIRRIYEESAPPISSAMQPLAREFLVEVVKIVRSAIESAGGQFNVPKAA